MKKADCEGAPHPIENSLATTPTELSHAPSRSTKAATSLPRKMRCTSINIQKMSMLQEEIKRIDKQIEALQEVEANRESFISASVNELEGEERDIEDPELAHMLVVELCELCASGDVAGVRILIGGGIDPNGRDYYGSPFLHIAAANGQTAVVETLLELGAECASVDSRGCTAAEVAEENGFVELAQMLSKQLNEFELASGGTFSLAIEKAFTSKELSSPNSQLSLPLSSVPQPMVGSLVVIMVGLPGRGKSYVGHQICRYFQWNGLMCKIFSHQLYQRNHLQKFSLEETVATGGGVSEPLVEADLANKVILEITKDILEFLSSTEGVAILDGTNSTNARRQAILRSLNESQKIKLKRIVFIEILTQNEETIRRNISRAREMLVDPIEDFEQRYYANIARHESIYETLNPVRDSALSYIQIQDNDLYFLNLILGWMPSRLAYMLHNFNQSQQNVYLTRAGEYVNLISGRIGGNSDLTDRGVAYGIALFNFFKEEVGASKPLQVMSSSMLRCMQTVRYFAEESARRIPSSCTSQEEEAVEVKLNCNVDYIPSLEDISYGDCDGQLLTDIRKTMLSTLQAIQADSYNTPWPNGECIHHVFNTRLEPHIHDIQASSTPVLVVSHRALLQGLYAYFVTKDAQVVAPQNAYQIKIPLETVVRIRIFGVHRVAEFVNLSKEVDQIELEMTGRVTRAPQLDINKPLNLPRNLSNPEFKGVAKPLK